MSEFIRLLESRDRPSLEAILSDTSVFSPEETSVALELIDIALNNPEQTDYHIFVLTQQDEVIGYHCTGKRPLTDGVYDLYWIVVNQQKAGKGSGSLLLHHAEEFVNGVKGRWLLCETSSRAIYDKTRSFYVKNGYTVIASIPDFYSAGDALMIYGKSFKN